MKFPKDMLWGSASADMQYEGGFSEGGRLPSTHDYITAGSNSKLRSIMCKNEDGEIIDIPVAIHKNGTIPETATPVLVDEEYYPSHQAVDFYHHYKEDIKLLADMGLNCMRFSICWSRIFPRGDEKCPNEEGLKFYDDVINECVKYGIEPLITICHDELPVFLAEQYGGWENRKTIDFYLNLCRVLFENFGDRVKYWITFNEVNLLKGFSRFGAKEDNLQVKYQCTHHIFIASSKAIKLGRELMPNAKFSAMFAMSPSYPETCNPLDVLATVEQQQRNGFFTDVMVRGYYPSHQKHFFDEKNISIAWEEADDEILKNNTIDFISFSCYRSNVVYAKDFNYRDSMTRNPYLEKTEWGWALDPYSLRHTCNAAWEKYQIPLFIVENGLGEVDIPNESLYVEDDYRIQYLNDHFCEIKKAIEIDGVEILGYTMWGGIDLVSLSTGEMKKRYGWIYVDMDDAGNGTKQRVPKKSYYWMQEFLKTEGKNLVYQV